MNDKGRRAHPLALLLATLLLAGCGLVDDAPRRLQHAQQALARNDYAAALVSLKAAVERDDTSSAARLAFAQFLFDAGDLAGAGTQLERARALGADPAMLRRQQLELAMAMRQPTEALRLLDGAGHGTRAAADPASRAGPGSEQVELEVLRGRVLLAADRRDEGRAILGRFEAQPAAQVALATDDLAHGDVAAAAGRVERLLASEPANVPARNLAGQIAALRGDVLRATAHFEAARAVAGVPMRHHVSALTGLCEALLARGQARAAEPLSRQISAWLPGSALARMLAARVALGSNRIDEGIGLLQEIATREPRNARALVLLGDLQLQRGNPQQAEIYLQRAVSIDVDHPGTRELLALAQLRRARPGDAVDTLAPLLERGALGPETLALASAASWQGGDREGAIRLLEQLSAKARHNIDAQASLVVAYLAVGRDAAARSVIESLPAGVVLAEALLRQRTGTVTAATAPEAGRVEAGLARLATAPRSSPRLVLEHTAFLLYAGRPGAARGALRGVLAAARPAPAALFLGAQIEAADGQVPAARLLLQRYVQRDSGVARGHAALAALDAASGALEAADQNLQRARSAAPADPRLELGRALIASARHDATAMDAALEAFVLKAGEGGATRRMAGDMLLQAGQPELARRHFALAAQRDPDDGLAQVGLAQAQLAGGNPAAARALLEARLRLQPFWLPATATLIALELDAGATDRALLLAQGLRVRQPAAALPLALEGRVLARMGASAASDRAYQQAVERAPGTELVLERYRARLHAGAATSQAAAATVLRDWLNSHPGDVRVRLALASDLFAQDRRRESAAEFEQVLAAQPENVIALNNLAWLYNASTNARALELARRARAVAPASHEVADTLGWVLVTRGDTAEGLRYLDEVVAVRTAGAGSGFRRAVALARLGRRTEALAQLERVLKTDKRFAERAAAEKMLHELQRASAA